jgi:hypothetical protein
MSKFSLPKDEAVETPVDIAALQAFAAGAKERSTAQGKPWERHDPKALPKHNVSVRLNDYQMEVLKYVAEALDMSQQKVLRKHALTTLEQLAEKIYAERAAKMDSTQSKAT